MLELYIFMSTVDKTPASLLAVRMNNSLKADVLHQNLKLHIIFRVYDYVNIFTDFQFVGQFVRNILCQKIIDTIDVPKIELAIVPTASVVSALSRFSM